MAHLRPRVITGRAPRRGSEVRGFSPPEDSYISKVIKYIPAETIAGYQAGISIIPEISQSSVTPFFAIFLLIFTPLWTSPIKLPLDADRPSVLSQRFV
jgi:hypothetical protein